mmetsp:Transcript_36429/g.84052  ORF Transcript_36429/g.84052 Transcript_36429/m.84052 type:complete len:94 (-) Transcript_36429:47-328(-)
MKQSSSYAMKQFLLLVACVAGRKIVHEDNRALNVAKNSTAQAGQTSAEMNEIKAFEAKAMEMFSRLEGQIGRNHLEEACRRGLPLMTNVRRSS